MTDLLITSPTICTIVFSRFCAQIYPAALSSWNFHRMATRDSMVSGDDANAPNLLCARLKAECVKIPFCVWGDPINYLNRNENGVDIKFKSHRCPNARSLWSHKIEICLIDSYILSSLKAKQKCPRHKGNTTPTIGCDVSVSSLH